MRLFATVASAIFSFLFVAALWLPLIQQVTGFAHFHGKRVREGRRLAPCPRFQIQQLLNFPQRFEKFYEDHFGFRSQLILLNNSLRFKLFGVSPVRSVVAGKEGWFFLSAEMETAENKHRGALKESELNRLLKLYETRRDFVQAVGAKYLILIPPNKITVYPEAWPDHLKRRRGPSRLEQFASFFKANSNVEVLDLTAPLLAAKKQYAEQLYFKTDSHWNELGAFAGYSALTHELQRLFPNLSLKPLTLSDFVISVRTTHGGGLNRMLGLLFKATTKDSYLKEKKPDPWYQRSLEQLKKGSPIIIKREGEPDTLIPKGVVFRDSFFTKITRYATKHFAELALYPSTYTTFDPRLIEREKPSLVIDQFVERNLRLPSPADERALRYMQRWLVKEGYER